MNKLKLIIASVLATFGLVAGVAMPALAQNNGSSNLACGSSGDITKGLNPGTANCDVAGADNRVQSTIKLAIRVFQIIVGVIAVFYVITGGLKYITSGGESGGVTGAKNTILYAAIGLIVVALAEVVVQFVLNRANSTTQTF